MDRFVERCAGLDVHKDSVAASVRIPGPGEQRLQETRTFSATTRGLLTLRRWQRSAYWSPISPRLLNGRNG